MSERSSGKESKKNPDSGPRPLRKCFKRIDSAIPRSGQDSMVFINLAHAAPRDSDFCCSKQMTSHRSFTAWGVGKNVRQKAFCKVLVPLHTSHIERIPLFSSPH
jgi:hypothetical protein